MAVGTFDAFGVRFASTFPLPEIREDRPPPAACVLALGSTDEPARRFSGPCDPPKVGVTAQGRTERGRDGDLLLRFRSEASFWMSAAADSVVWAGAGPAARRFLLDTVLGSVALARGFEALHAGAVLTDAGVVAVSVGEGGGKSSLVAALLARGLPLFTDDLLMLDAGVDVVAHPGPALMNLPPRAVEVAADVLATFDDEAWVVVDRPPVAPAPIVAVVLLERGGADVLTVERRAPSAMDLLPLSLQGGSTPDRQRTRFEACAGVAATAAVLRLAAPLDVPPDALADAVLEALPA